jgi:prepilin-type N-terminal cleavage/methylation domain-containing protein
MKAGSRPRGFTIVETLIVLAVTGMLFAAAVILISGRQNKTEFSTGSRQLQSSFQRVIDDIANGYYPSNGSLKCQNNAGLPDFKTASVPTSDCMFLGKAIQFKVHNTDPEAFNIYSVIGVRLNSSNESVTTIQEAKPKVIDTTGLFETETLPYGMTTGWVKSDDDSLIGAVGFLSSIGYIDSSGNAQGPSQQVDVYPILGTHLNDDPTTAVGIIDNNQVAPNGLERAVPVKGNGARICVDSGGTDQHAIYTIGGQGRALNVSFKIQNGSCQDDTTS